MRLYKLFFVIIFINSLSSTFAFYPINWEDLMYQMEKGMSWQSARLETNVKIFDPFFKNSNNEVPKYPREIPGRGYNQVIHWKDGKVLVIETKGSNGNLIHFYYENKSDILSVSVDDNRTFFTEEVLPLHLRFKSRYEKKRIKALEEFGILSKTISFHLKKDKNIFLRIGNFESGHFALINPKSYELSEMHSKIWTGSKTWMNLKIIFKNFIKYRWQTYPEITEYYLNDRLFKRVKITKIRTLSSLPMKELKKQAKNLGTPQTLNLKNDYAL